MSIQDINRNLDGWKRETEAGIYGVAQNIGAKAEESAKRFAPWKDQTGNARQGLFSKVFWEGTTIILALCHRVDYGVSLELDNDGKYAILEPTLNRFKGSLYRWVKKIVEG